MAGQGNSEGSTRSFDKGVNLDIKDFHSQSNNWTYALNAINNSVTGDSGDLGSEPATMYCSSTPYTIIGAIYISGDTFALFSTNDTDSEVGLFDSSQCIYTKVVNDRCLAFKRTNLITGVYKKNADCSRNVYFDDGLNPSRRLNVDDVPYVQVCTTTAGCTTCVDTTVLNCDLLRLARLVQEPCLQIKKGAAGGNLLNGSYFVTIAYAINGQKVTDFFTPSIPQALFNHSNVAGSIDIALSNLDKTFDEYILAVVSIVNQQTQVKQYGIFNTRQAHISIDQISNELIDIPISQIPLHTPIVDKSDAMYEVNNYLLRVGPTEKFDFNYQPLANQILAKWQSVEYPQDYYKRGGNQTSYLRDENYAFEIQWGYSDGDWSSSYHIPGRAPTNFTIPGGATLLETAVAPIVGSDNLDPGNERVFEQFNTASVTNPFVNTSAPDGIGLILSEGLMGYWESTDLYPDDKPAVWGALCGQPIRHHKFPEQATDAGQTTHHYRTGGGLFIRLMGVRFENIQAPVDNAGNPITNITRYRILRGSREGNKTIVAKGMINNMWQYNIEGGSSRTGLYPNYPYNDLQDDHFISTTDTSFSGGSIQNYNPSPGEGNPNPPNYRKDAFTFHSPDTQFRNPFLSMKEMKIYGEMTGTTDGEFVEPSKHPKHKLLTDVSFYVALIAGVGIASIAMNGERRTSYVFPEKSGSIPGGTMAAGSGLFGVDDPGAIAANLAGAAMSPTMYGALQLAQTPFSAGGQLLANLAGNSTALMYGLLAGIGDGFSVIPGVSGQSINIEQQGGKLDGTPTVFGLAGQALPTFLYYLSEGGDSVLRLIQSVLPYQQYALQYQSHCFYDSWLNNGVSGNKRRPLLDSLYLDDSMQDFGSNYKINNLYRGRSVALGLPPSSPLTSNTFNTDASRVTVGDLGYWANPLRPFHTPAASFYVSLKNELKAQYGQIGGFHKIPIGCAVPYTFPVVGSLPLKSPLMFGGDTYINRYTEKNTMFFFYDWMYDQPDGFEFNYHLHKMVPFPAYWMDTRTVDIPSFLGSIVPNLTTPGSWATPSHERVMDRGANSNLFELQRAYMYIFNSGVRDFFVESDVNVDLRDYGSNPGETFYDPFGKHTDLKALFSVPVIKTGNFFKYDYSLSVSKLFTNFISWAASQPINYDPLIYASCYIHYKNRVIYSLPSTSELIRDNWEIFLANNYKDFKTPITSIKPINKSGAMMFFATESPIQITGVDTLQTDAGTKITIGDGGLFSQPLQNVITSDKPIEYGSCQNRQSIINTPMGMFWMSQNQGKIFQLEGGVQEISMTDIKWWFAQYLPYFLTVQFPTFELQDNPVIGIGCQTMYDSENGLVYFMKKDFKVRTDLPVGTVVTYVSANNFIVTSVGGAQLPIVLGDLNYFEDCSWTVSFDIKTKNWVSWHSWTPELTIPSKNTFMSVVTDPITGQGGIWMHNERSDLYCNYYGKDHPFEVEFKVNTVQQTTTLRSVEMQVEVYTYATNAHDRYLSLDEFFDEAVVTNNEQCSGLLHLNLTPKNDPYKLLGYPKYNPSSVDILYARVEGKYRFNQFADLTDDRGEYSNARRTIWLTPSNGYSRVLNSNNLDYFKPAFQRKKLRGYTCNVLLRRKVCGPLKFLILLGNIKSLNSPR